jgi:hypothetical protein
MTDQSPATGRLVILWANGTSYATEVPDTLALSIMGQIQAGEWCSWRHGNQSGLINPAHVADITFTAAEPGPR